MNRRILYNILFLPLLLTSCMGYGPMDEEAFDTGGGGNFSAGSVVTGRGLFITNEGNFMYGNASLSYYDPETGHVENEVFARANAQKLGDVAQSMTMHGGLGWIVVNNSGVIFAIDPNTFKEVGRITGFTSPRYIHFLSDEKAYVTQIWDPRIYIVNPKTYQITGYVETDMDYESGSTEQMVQYGKYLFTNCWSYQNRILKIDTETDEVVDELVVGIQPTSLVMDCNNKMWTITDGGYEGSPYGHEAPSLYRIDAETFKIEKQFKFKFGDWPSEVQLNGTKDKIYWLNNSVWCMDVTADRVPVRPFLEYHNTLYYGLTINPVNGDVYIADAIDYVQSGVILRYSSEGELLDSFTVGIIPGAFCWKEEPALEMPHGLYGIVWQGTLRFAGESTDYAMTVEFRDNGTGHYRSDDERFHGDYAQSDFTCELRERTIAITGNTASCLLRGTWTMAPETSYRRIVLRRTDDAILILNKPVS